MRVALHRGISTPSLPSLPSGRWVNLWTPPDVSKDLGVTAIELLSAHAFVQQMHNAGIEVILDVVYNHTVEGNHVGSTLSFRGINNKSNYYLMQDEFGKPFGSAAASSNGRAYIRSCARVPGSGASGDVRPGTQTAAASHV